MFASQRSNPILVKPRRKFSRFDPIVYTTLFHWFTTDAGNVTGPWVPVEGRAAWTGTKGWWMTQIKQIMMANIDMVLVHLITRFEEQRITFFAACHELRKQGYDVPKVVPFLDPFGIWPPEKVDVGTARGKDEFVSHYLRFFEQYFSQADDAQAADYLGQIDGRVALSTWWVYTILENLQDFTRQDVETRIRRALAHRSEAFSNGIHMISTALIDPDLTFTDERAVFFSGFAYCLQSIHQEVRTYHVQAGYWDQNLRPGGFRLPRDGGRPYKEAWEFVLAQAAFTHRVYVESWNEYDEGSGIYAGDPARIFTPPGLTLPRADRWSDTDDPFEYIRTTASGAARFNRLQAYDAAVLQHDVPARIRRNERCHVTVVVRNEGNTPWLGSAGVEFALETSSFKWTGVDSCRVDDEANESAAYGGVFKGRPVVFQFDLLAPPTQGKFEFTWRMRHSSHEFFGEPLQARIEIL